MRTCPPHFVVNFKLYLNFNLCHGLNDFGDGHPVIDFTGEPCVVLGVPFIGVLITPSDDLQSFHIGNQHGFALLGHLVLGSYPGHRLGFRGFREWHPVKHFMGPPRIIFGVGVPRFVVFIPPSDNLHSFIVSNQHELVVQGHLVFGLYPGHG